MFNDFLTVGQQVLILFILIGIGFLCGKINFLNHNSSKCITNIILYFVTPCVIIDSFQREFNSDLLFNLGINALCAVGIHLLSIIIARIAFKDKDSSRDCVLRFGVVFSNCGFMSIPLQSVLLGSEGVFYGATFIAVFNIVLWSYGLISMSGDRKSITPKKLLLNPGLIGVVIGFIFFVFSISLPPVLKSPVNYMAMLNTPLPMLIIGYHLSQANLKKALKGTSQYISIALRLIVVPILSLVIMWFCNVRGILFISCVISVAAPVAASTTMFAEKFGKDVELSVNLVSISTILSIITMPLIVGYAKLIA